MSVRISYNIRPRDKRKYQIRYYDNNGKRRSKQFLTTEERELFKITLGGELLEGTHIPDKASKTVKAAGEIWLKSTDVMRLRHSTREQYRSFLEHHIYRFIGNQLLNKLDVGGIKAFRDNMHRNGRSEVLTAKVIATLHTLLADAVERKFCKHNPVKDLKRSYRKEKKRKLQVGVDIPTNDDIRAILQAAEGEWRAAILTMIFTGTRSNELLALRWCDVNFDRQEIYIRQALDRATRTFHDPKSEAGKRTIPILPFLANTLREHKMKCPPRLDGSPEADLVFHRGGKSVRAQHFVHYGLLPTLVKAGIIKPPVKRDGRWVYEDRKYTGPHCYRHWFVSWNINSESDGGLGTDVKRVSEMIGHSSVIITLSIYGHLFPKADQRSAMAQAERAFFGR